MKLNLRSLSRVVSQKTKMTEESVSLILKTFIAEVLNHMKGGGIVGIKGFGTFFVSKRSGRSIVHPRTGETIEYQGHNQPRMKFSTRVKKGFRRAVDKF